MPSSGTEEVEMDRDQPQRRTGGNCVQTAGLVVVAVLLALLVALALLQWWQQAA